MNNLKKAFALGIAAVLSAGMLAGCGASKAPADKAETKATEAAAAADSNALVMGTNAAFEPFEYTTTKGLVGEFDGIDVAIAQKIAEKAGRSLEISDMEFDGLIAAVSNGKVDMAVAGMTVTEERKQNVDFSDTYYTASQVILVKPEDTSITCGEDLKNGKKVGVVLSYTGDSIVTDTLKIDDANIQRANRALDICQDVKNGKLDAVVVDSYTGKALAEKNGLKVVEDPKVFETEEYAIAVKKGNKELLDVINATLKEMKEKGEIEALAEKYNNIEK